jgi:hypothetical protein
VVDIEGNDPLLIVALNINAGAVAPAIPDIF